MMSKLADCFPDDVALLAPNGPFPVPQRKPDGSYRVGCAWYFYDPKVDQYYIDMEAALTLLEALTRERNATGAPLHLVGYSQGGYLAPFVAERLPGVRRLVGMAADFLVDEVTLAPGLPVDWILGLDDEVVEAPGVRAHLADLRRRGFPVQEHALAGQGHLITEQMKATLRAVVAK
jgi:predicted esterase